jgi:hypothetical protein
MENHITGALKKGFHVGYRTAAILALVLAAGMCGQGPAQATELLGMQGPFVGSEGPTVGQPVFTPNGPGIVTGNLGSLETTTLPGSAGTGFLENNGNGTSTLIVPGGPSQVVPTPR